MASNRMTKERLQEYADLQKEIANQNRRIRQKRLEIIAPPPPSGGMPPSGQVIDRVGAQVTEILELERIRDEANTRLLQETVLIESAIQTLRYSKHREVLRLRYIDGMKWTVISDLLHYSIQHLQQWHNDAIAELERKINHDEEHEEEHEEVHEVVGK